MISGANFMDKYSTKDMFTAAGYDFYTYHPYGFAPQMVTGGASEGRKWTVGWQTMSGLCEHMNDKPLVFTEWGGYYIHNNPKLFSDFLHELFRLGSAETSQPVLAGIAQWVWADYYEHHRPQPSNCDGVTIEGLMDMNRVPHENLGVFMQELAIHNSPEKKLTQKIEVTGFGDNAETYIPLSISNVKDEQLQKDAWDSEVEKFMNHRITTTERARFMEYGPVLPESIYSIGCLPVMLNKGKPVVCSNFTGEVTIPASVRASRLHIIGNCTFSYSYPILGEYGKKAAEYVLEYEDGSIERVLLREGIELTTVHCLYSATEFDPCGSALNDALRITFDPSWEIYKIPIFSIDLANGKALKSITMRTIDKECSFMLYGITAEL